MKISSGILAGFCISLLLCSSATRADPLKIRIGWIVAPAELTSYMFAKEGIARHNGVSYTLEPTHFQGSPLEITAVQSGDLDIAPFGSSRSRSPSKMRGSTICASSPMKSRMAYRAGPAPNSGC